MCSSVHLLTGVFLLCNWHLYLLLVYVFLIHVCCVISIQYNDDDDDDDDDDDETFLRRSVRLSVCPRYRPLQHSAPGSQD